MICLKHFCLNIANIYVSNNDLLNIEFNSKFDVVENTSKYI